MTVKREFRSKVLRTTPTSPSVRARIPETVATMLEAEPGSTLVWTVESGDKIAIVSVESTPSKGRKTKSSKDA